MELPVNIWRRFTSEWKALIEEPVPLADLDASMQQASVPHFGFYLMLALSVVIATLGLLANSAAAIIGAMIIAPLLGPIISLSYGITVTNGRLIYRSLATLVSGIVVVVVLSFACTQIIGLRIAGSEILGRTFPTLLDMGVAMAAGAAAAYAQTRRSIINSIAGVAIAVALVPPLAVTGIGLAQGQAASGDIGMSLQRIGLAEGGENIAAGAFLLFLTNLASIIVVAGIVFLANGYGKWQKAVVGLGIVTVLLVALVQPLGASLRRLYVKSQTLSLISQLQHQFPDLFIADGTLEQLNVIYDDDVVNIVVKFTAPRAMVRDMQQRVDLTQNYLERSLRQPVRIALKMVPVDIVEFEAGPGVERIQGESLGPAAAPRNLADSR